MSEDIRTETGTYNDAVVHLPQAHGERVAIDLGPDPLAFVHLGRLLCAGNISASIIISLQSAVGIDVIRRPYCFQKPY